MREYNFGVGPTQKLQRPTCRALPVHFSRSALRRERWLERYPLPYSVITLLAVPSQLFLQTLKYLLVRDAERFGLQLGLALNRSPRTPCLGLLFHGSHVHFVAVFPQGRLQRPPAAPHHLAHGRVICLDLEVGRQGDAEALADLAVGKAVHVPLDRRLDVLAHHFGRGWSPVIRPSVLEEAHQLAQSFEELVGVGAGVDHQVGPFLCWQVIEARAMVAKEHQDEVEGLVVTQLTERSTT